MSSVSDGCLKGLGRFKTINCNLAGTRGKRGKRASGGDAGRFLERKLRKELPGIFGRSSSDAGFFAPSELKKSLTIASWLKGC